MLQGGVTAALSRCWEGILACTAAQSFAVSLLDQRATQERIRPRCTRCCGVKCGADVHSHLAVFCVEILWVIFLQVFSVQKKGLECFLYVTANVVCRLLFFGECAQSAVPAKRALFVFEFVGFFFGGIPVVSQDATANRVKAR